MSRLARILAAAFLTTIGVGTLLLMLPVASTGISSWDTVAAGPRIGGGAPLSVAFFTATSATSVTGLTVVEATYWTTFGEAVLMVLFELGGLGSMTVISFLAMVLGNSVGLRSRELGSFAFQVNSGDVRPLLSNTIHFALTMQVIGFVLLTIRLWLRGEQPLSAAWHAAFLAVSAFNNAGFATYSDNLMGFNTDPWVLLTIAALIIVGGLGFPTILALHRSGSNWRRWRLNTRMVLFGTSLLLVGGTVAIGILEWDNPRTLGPMSVPNKTLNAFFGSVSPRTAGFNTIDVGAQHSETWLVTDVLMFVGGSPAGTAGGIKTTTALVLFFIVLRELRGTQHINALGWQLDPKVGSQAITVMGLSSAMIVTAAFALTQQSEVSLGQALYETCSAFGTVGLTTGITPQLPIASQVTIAILMMIGRLGPVTVATAMLLRRRKETYALPLDKPLIG